MLTYLEENGFPMSIFIETTNIEDTKTGWQGYESIVSDKDNNIIDKFNHKEFRGRVFWAKGFFASILYKNKKYK